MNDMPIECPDCRLVREPDYWCGNCDNYVTSTNDTKCCTCNSDLNQFNCTCN